MEAFNNADLEQLQELNQAVDFGKLGLNQNQAVDTLANDQATQRAGIPSFMNPKVFNALPQGETGGRIFAYLLEEPQPKTPKPLAPPTPNSVASQQLKTFSPKDANGTKNLLKSLESKQFGFSQSSGLDSLLQSSKPAAPATPAPGGDASGQQGKPVFTFLINPQSLKWNRKATYSQAATAATSVQAQQYYHTDGRALQIEGLHMEVWYYKRSLRPILEQLQLLLVPDVANESLSPKVLNFCWGSQTFTPCVLTSLNWTERSWLANGEPATVILSLELLEIPPPDGDLVSRWVGEQKKITGLGDGQTQSETGGGQAATGKEKGKKTKLAKQPVLTDRQQEDGSKKAEDWLKSNTSKLKPEVQQRLKTQNYGIQMDPKTGDYHLTTATGAKLGRIGNYDGTQFDTTKNSIPKAKRSRGN